jgi:lipopolysaccharide/colanic/teichoic acid biosynthesis glycosyltransferase
LTFPQAAEAETIVNSSHTGHGAAAVPIAVSPFPQERCILTDEAFRQTIASERKRSERSRKPFMLLLLRMRDSFSPEKSEPMPRKILTTVSSFIRETDFAGWYENDSVVGVVFTEITVEDGNSIPATILARVTETLRGDLPAEQFNRLSFTYHVFPEDQDDNRNANDGQRPSNPTLYPDLSQREDTRKWFRFMKRAMDVLGSLLALLLLSPLFLIIALAVKVTSQGPVFFRQRRLGQFGKPFVFLKFRSMYVNNDASVHREYVTQLIAGKAGKQPVSGSDDGVYKLTNDPRISRVGAFLRRTSLDELPQFINVLKGEMSLVGPRPPIPYEAEAYDIWHRRRLLEAKPGLTGLWQVCGRSRVKFDDMVRLDLQYARTWSPWMDLKILARTPGAVLLGEGAR